MRHQRVWLIALMALLLPAAGLAAADNDAVRGSFERTLKVSGPVNIEVKTGSGDIKVHAGEAGRVEIKGRIQGHIDGGDGAGIEERVRYLEAHPPIEQDGNHIRVGPIEDHERSRNISIDYELTVPAESELTSQSGSGDLTVEGIRGPVNVRSGSGDITLRSVGGAVRAKTGSGDAKFEGISGDHVEVETGSGDLQLRDVRCALDLQAGSGDINVQGEPTGAWVMRTGSGGIAVHLPSDKGFDLDAHTNSGGITTSFPITVQGAIGHGDLHGKVRGGGVRVEARTGAGDISIE